MSKKYQPPFAGTPADGVKEVMEGLELTSIAVVIHQDDLRNQVIWSSVYNAVYGAEKRTPALVMERDNDTGVGEILQVQLLLTADRQREKETDEDENARGCKTFAVHQPLHDCMFVWAKQCHSCNE